MNAVMEIKSKYEAQEARRMDELVRLCQGEEIKARRRARMQKEHQEALQRAAEARVARRKLEKRAEATRQREVADAAASVAAGLTMAASLLGIAILL